MVVNINDFFEFIKIVYEALQDTMFFDSHCVVKISAALFVYARHQTLG